MYIEIYIILFLFLMYIEIYIRKETKTMRFTYADFFKTADKEKRKLLIDNLADEYLESNAHERRYLRKQYEQIQQILFDEGKRPM